MRAAAEAADGVDSSQQSSGSGPGGGGIPGLGAGAGAARPSPPVIALLKLCSLVH